MLTLQSPPIEPILFMPPIGLMLFTGFGPIMAPGMGTLVGMTFWFGNICCGGPENV
jgi:hypothetical protein